MVGERHRARVLFTPGMMAWKTMRQNPRLGEESTRSYSMMRGCIELPRGGRQEDSSGTKNGWMMTDCDGSISRLYRVNMRDFSFVYIFHDTAWHGLMELELLLGSRLRCII